MKGGLREKTEGKKDDSMISGRKGPATKKKQNVEAGCCFKLSNSIPTPTPREYSPANATSWSRTALVIFRKQTYVILKPKELQKLGLDTPRHMLLAMAL